MVALQVEGKAKEQGKDSVCLAGEGEEILSAECDINMLAEIKGSIPVFRDRRQELYSI